MGLSRSTQSFCQVAQSLCLARLGRMLVGTECLSGKHQVLMMKPKLIASCSFGTWDKIVLSNPNHVPVQMLLTNLDSHIQQIKSCWYYARFDFDPACPCLRCCLFEIVSWFRFRFVSWGWIFNLLSVTCACGPWYFFSYFAWVPAMIGIMSGNLR